MNRREEILEKISRVLDRQTEVNSLDALVAALRGEENAVQLQDTAIGLDANVFLRLSSHNKSEDIIDYLGSAHPAPLILPGQAIQEFWNNQLNAIDTVAAGIRKKFDALNKEFEKADLKNIESNVGEFVEKFDKLLDEFRLEHGYIYDPGTIRRTSSFLEALKNRARVPYVPRAYFGAIAESRKRTKTPPGFLDDGDGDFYIWADLLTGLLEAREEGHEFSRVVLVSNDQKIDWSRNGVTHPILVTEVAVLLNVPFEIWKLDTLADEISGK